MHYTPSTRPMLISSLAAALCLSACVPDLGPEPAPQAPRAFATEKSVAGQAGEWPLDNWWQAYRDAELDRLEDEAFNGSPDLKIARARLRAAEGAAQVAGAALLPDLTLDAS